MAKYADFINEQSGKQLEQSNRRQKYSGWIEDPTTGQGRAIDTQGNIIKLAQKPSEEEFVSKPTGSPQGDFVKTAEGDYNKIDRFDTGGSFRTEYPKEFSQQQDTAQLDITEIPQKQFNIGKIAIENDYIKNTNLIKQTVTDITQYESLARDEEMIKNMRMQELMQKYQRSQIIFKKYSEDPTLDSKDRFLAQSTYLEKDPVFDISQAMKSVKPSKPIFSQMQQQRGIGKIYKELAGIQDRESAIEIATESFGVDFDETAPMVMKYIDENFPEDDGQIQQQQPKIPKPQGYPDATWNSQHNMWTIIKNGKLVGLQEQ